jgi:hypothetical protein
MSIVFGEREVVEDAARYWWLFLLTGITIVRLSCGITELIVAFKLLSLKRRLAA